jgi:hypothetical protein
MRPYMVENNLSESMNERYPVHMLDADALHAVPSTVFVHYRKGQGWWISRVHAPNFTN